MRERLLSFFSPPVGDDGAKSAARPSSPSGLSVKKSHSSAGRRRKAGARVTRPASLMADSRRVRSLSRGRAPRPRAAESAEAPASPTCTSSRNSTVTAGSAPAPSPSASRCTPSGLAATSKRASDSSTGSPEPSVPSVPRSAAERSPL
eukprot:scaffold13071_cov61-Phaeocystis_antarctica.AAC.1